MFVCVKGARFDGHSAAAEMLSKGAVMIVTDHDIKCGKQLVTDNTRLCLARLLNCFYGKPSEKLGLLAVTGTNGKTTTAHFVKHILTTLGKKCGCVGTAGNDTCSGELKPSQHGTPTVPRATVLYSWLGEMVSNGADYCVMEASSQALDQYRIGDERIAVAGFTNLTRDHLDYHGTMENYFQAKRRVFTMCKTAVINIDDEYGKRLATGVFRYCGNLQRRRQCRLSCEFIRMNATGCSYMLVNEREKTACRVDMNMTGLYNVQNSLCAIAMVTALGFDMTECAKALSDLDGVDGRMNVVYRGDFTVITDYAHTDDALIKVLSTLKPLTKGRLICVFGAAGDRDKEKRPMMAKAAEDNADILVITSDNPAHENPDEIIREVMTGISGKKPCRCITDRREAIAYALDTARKDDVIILCGKGHETYQIIGDEYLPFSEKEIVKDIMIRKEN
ncbi:MAG: UDP-N-acetylmuramoyl-L-alanyl-D-glutamate--2,6-diaminopimelate ligase [[Eubacterium] siraeum]